MFGLHEILPARAFWQDLRLMAPRRPASSRHQQIRSICEPVVCEGILRWCFAGLALPTDCEQAVNGKLSWSNHILSERTKVYADYS